MKNMILKDRLLYLVSALIIVFSFSIALSKGLRNSLNTYLLNSHKREVLSVLNYRTVKKTYKILKIKKKNSIFIEIYDQKSQVHQFFTLGKYSDGSIFLDGKNTSLASYDLDKSGTKEVVIPTLSKDRKSLVFILKYNPQSERFKLDSPVNYMDRLSL